MPPKKNLQDELEECIARAESRGFTREYQEQKESEANVVSHSPLAPAISIRYDAMRKI